jgi:hypothetical protein
MRSRLRAHCTGTTGPVVDSAGPSVEVDVPSEARVGGRELQGIDLLRRDTAGQIAEFTVMIRPATGLIAVAERMGPALEAAGVR